MGSVKATMLVLLAFGLLAGCQPPAASADEPERPDASEMRVDLEKHRWNERLILLFGPAEDDPALARMRATLDASEDDLQERDVRVYTRVGDTPEHRRFEVAEQEVRYILIGLDGQQTMRGEVLDLDEVLRTIDAMPMRLRELQRRSRSQDP